jgi:hypothetical protein
MRFTALAAALGALASGACARAGAGRAPSPSFASPTIIAGSPAPRTSDPMPPEEPAGAPAAKPAKLAKPAKPAKPRPADARPADARPDDRSASRQLDARPADDRRKDQPKTAIRSVTAAPIRVVSAARPPGASPDAGVDDTPKPDRRADAEPDRRSAAKPDRPPNADSGGRRADADAADAAGDVADPPTASPKQPALRAPHRGGEPQPPPTLRTPADLRELVGRRDARDSFAAVAAWSRALGAPVAATSGAELVSWAAESHRLHPATEPTRPGDLLIFDQAASDDASDLVAIVLDRDEHGVTELLYLGGGVVRRGLVDASRPAVHRDTRGATVNTHLRHGRRWPAKGMHYLAGELLAHVVRPR